VCLCLLCGWMWSLSRSPSTPESGAHGLKGRGGDEFAAPAVRCGRCVAAHRRLNSTIVLLWGDSSVGKPHRQDTGAVTVGERKVRRRWPERSHRYPPELRIGVKHDHDGHVISHPLRGPKILIRHRLRRRPGCEFVQHRLTSSHASSNRSRPTGSGHCTASRSRRRAVGRYRSTPRWRGQATSVAGGRRQGRPWSAKRRDNVPKGG
jgi:hypothetical protein